MTTGTDVLLGVRWERVFAGSLVMKAIPRIWDKIRDTAACRCAPVWHSRACRITRSFAGTCTYTLALHLHPLYGQVFVQNIGERPLSAIRSDRGFLSGHRLATRQLQRWFLGWTHERSIDQLLSPHSRK